jgi:N-acetylglucosaminyl-diphospho-decaprenol L-rhamnosyltransferase
VQIDVVIPTWNKAELLAHCLGDLARQTVPHRVIVADNGSEDGTVAMVGERFPDVTLIEMRKNLGFGRAINRASAAGDAEVIVVLNNDVNVEPSFLSEIVAPLADATVGMVAGVLLDPATGLIDAAGVEIDGGLAGYPYMGGLPPAELDLPRTGLLGPCGAAAAYRRKAFESVAGFDERIFLYSEDLDIALRLRAAGWRCELAPAAQAMHLGSATLGVRSITQVRLAARARGYVLGCYRVRASWLLTELCVALADSLLLRSLAPLSGRLGGWREGRAQPHRPLPGGSVSPALTRLSRLSRRWRAAFPRASARRLRRRSP